MTRYPHLFSPLQIGPVKARNRIMQTAHVKLFTTDGIDSLRNVAYQVERAKGGAGLLITGNRLIHPTSTTGMARFAYQYLKGALEIDRKMTSGVHEHGALMFAQLNHFGLNATSDSADDLRVLWGPSAVKSPAYGETPKAMEHEDIAEVVEWWARSAELAREGGFDGTEVHIAHSYLLHQFLSPVYNKRDDEYGGSLENRLRFTREVIDEVRRRTGDDWAIGIRLTLSEFMGEGSLDIEDAKETVRLLESMVQARLRQRQRGRLPQHLQGDRALGRAGRLPRRPERPGEGDRPAFRCSRSAASRIRCSPRRSSPRAGQTWSR